MANVTIVGAGLMGTATAFPLAENGHTVRLVGTHLDRDIIGSCKERHYHPRLRRELPPGVEAYFVEEIAEAFERTDIVVSGVNSLGVRWIGKTIGPLLRPGQMIIAITKGLEVTADGDLMILPDVLAGELPPSIRGQIGFAAVGGPCIAGELAGRRHSCVIFGSRDREVGDALGAAFQTSYYHVWTTTDLVGLEYCAALKNAYALGVGLAAGLLERAGGVDAAGAHMHNLAAAVFAQSCAEIGRILRAAGVTLQFAVGLLGPGDLYVTCQGGRTVRLGKLLGLGHTYPEARRIMAGETLESVEIIRVMGEALPHLVARGLLEANDLPLMRALIDVVVHGRPVDLPLAEFDWGLPHSAGR
jgi:glycerol-3-phosphate dehydrogenase (NAD(P)+)